MSERAAAAIGDDVGAAESEALEEERDSASGEVGSVEGEGSAEEALESMRRRVEELERSLGEARAQLEASERRQRVDQLLIEAEAVDLEAGRLLTEHALETMEDADVEAAVSDLRRRKPYLFRRRHGAAGGGAMAGKARGGVGGDLSRAAESAATSGDRRDLLRYLRLRRRRA